MYMYCQCSDPRKIIDKITQYTFFWSYINFIGTQKKIVIVFFMAWCCYHWFHHLYVDKMVSVQ